MNGPATDKFHPAFVAALEAEREQVNQRFRLTCLQGAAIDREAFFAHLIERVQPIVAAVAEVFPERTRLTTSELVDVSLELFRAGFWGKESRCVGLDQLWKEVFPRLARLVSRQPQRAAAALSNATINLANNATIRGEQWLSELETVGSQCESVDQLLDVGRIIAWRAGLAQYRSIALAALVRLPRGLAARSLGLATTPDEPDWHRTLARLGQQPWWPPEDRESERSSGPRLAHRCSGFLGFGGNFQQPPLVALHEGRLLVNDHESTWLLIADRYGWYLHRVVPTEFKSTRSGPPGTVHIADDGTVVWGKSRRVFPEFVDVSSQAFDGQSLAVTLASSFHVYLIAPPIESLHGQSI